MSGDSRGTSRPARAKLQRSREEMGIGGPHPTPRAAGGSDQEGAEVGSRPTVTRRGRRAASAFAGVPRHRRPGCWQLPRSCARPGMVVGTALASAHGGSDACPERMDVLAPCMAAMIAPRRAADAPDPAAACLPLLSASRGCARRPLLGGGAGPAHQRNAAYPHTGTHTTRPQTSPPARPQQPRVKRLSCTCHLPPPLPRFSVPLVFLPFYRRWTKPHHCISSATDLAPRAAALPTTVIAPALAIAAGPTHRVADLAAAKTTEGGRLARL